MLTYSTKVPHEDKPSETLVVSEETKDRVLIFHMWHKENHFTRDYKSNVVKNKTYYLRMAQEVEEKEKEKAFMAHV